MGVDDKSVALKLVFNSLIVAKYAGGSDYLFL
jgi:hypothetical protein